MYSTLKNDVNTLADSLLESLLLEDKEHLLEASWIYNFDVINQEM